MIEESDSPSKNTIELKPNHEQLRPVFEAFGRAHAAALLKQSLQLKRADDTSPFDRLVYKDLADSDGIYKIEARHDPVDGKLRTLSVKYTTFDQDKQPPQAVTFAYLGFWSVYPEGFGDSGLNRILPRATYLLNSYAEIMNKSSSPVR